MHAELIVLRLVHILAGTFWVGSGIYSALFLLPAVTEAGPQARNAVFAGLQRRKLFLVLQIVPALVVLSGLRLLHITSSGFDGAYFRTPMGRTFAFAGGLAILAWLIAIVVSRPAAARMAAL